MTIPRTQTLRTDRFEMDYVRFGHGEKTLVMIPGLSLNGVRGSAAMLACLYQIFAKVYTVYLYEEFGHAAYEEAKDFNQRVLNFLTEPN